MKITKVLGAYFRGLKIPALVLMLMITVSTLLGTIVFTCVNSITNYYYYLKDNNLNNAYYVSLSFDEISVES
ncbi:MAG: hypothetical protein LUH54_00150, partial [Firmicutes bacterium]|nr:hypothetical protein [Bacillota bacterium]